MKNRFIVVYTVFAAAVFIFSISFFGFNLFKEYSGNQTKSETRYTNLINDIRTISYNQESNNAKYIQSIKDSIGDAGNYSYIQVRRDNETVILYPSDKLKEETVSRLTKNYTSNLTVNNQHISVECNLYLIRPDSIFYYARISFLMILIITIITIIMIIYLNLSEATSDVISEEFTEDEDLIEASEENTIEAADESEKIAEDESEIKDENPADIKEETLEENSEEAEKENHAEVTPEEVKAILTEPLTDEQVAAAEAAKLPIDEIKPAPLSVNEEEGSDNSPSGLFDPETGIGWESYLLTRLNNEIDRATASEIDLSLFIFKLNSQNITSEVVKNVCNYLSIQFQFKDLLFEYKDDCIVAIKISMNVDEALKLADKLFVDISNIVNNKDTRIGISSRSIRMVGGERLLLEAEQAIEHSDANSPVIAFRVDLEKYRKMMEANQGN